MTSAREVAHRVLGHPYPRLDDKGRLFLPAKFRERLSLRCRRHPGMEHCLFVYPYDEFVLVEQKMRLAPQSSRQVRDFTRLLLSGASDEIPDRQGRITIPTHLRAYAGLTHECTVIGTGSRLEVWDSQAWAAYLENTEAAFADQAEEVVPGLF